MNQLKVSLTLIISFALLSSVCYILSEREALKVKKAYDSMSFGSLFKRNLDAICPGQPAGVKLLPIFLQQNLQFWRDCENHLEWERMRVVALLLCLCLCIGLFTIVLLIVAAFFVWKRLEFDNTQSLFETLRSAHEASRDAGAEDDIAAACQHCPLALQVPPNIPSVILKPKTTCAGQDRTQTGRQRDLEKPTSRSSQSIQPEQLPDRPIIQLKARPALKRCGNAWKPSCLKTDTKDTTCLKEISRKLTELLNKLSDKNFNKISSQVVELCIEEPHTMNFMAQQLHQKAINEEGFAAIYADLAHKIKTRLGAKSVFINDLVEKCLIFATTVFDTTDAYEEGISRKRGRGNAKFVSELLKAGLVKPTFVLNLNDRFLERRDTMALECLAKSLTHSGLALQAASRRNKGLQSAFLSQIEKVNQMSNDKTIPFRLRCLLKDVIDARNNKWRPRGH